MKHLHFALFAALFCAFCTKGTAATPQGYSISEILEVGHTGFPDDVNDIGWVVGNRFLAFPREPFIWDGAHLILPGGEGRATGINNQGEVCLFRWNGSSYRSFIWIDGRETDLGDLGGSVVWAGDINAHSQITGTGMLGSAAVLRAFLWHSGSMQPLGTLGGDQSFGVALNANGAVVGRSEVQPNDSRLLHAFLWSNGAMTDLGTIRNLPSRSSAAADINDLGQVVGSSETENGEYRAFLWESGAMRDLGVLSDGPRNSASGINNLGQIVGSSGGEAFVFDGGRMARLSEMLAAGHGWELSQASAISDTGVIAGVGVPPSKAAPHAFLLQPHLPLYGPSPGTAHAPNSYLVRYSVPNRRVFFVYGLRAGSSSVSGCPGLRLGIHYPRLMGSATADAAGTAEVTVSVPSKASGRTIYGQAVELARCRVSNVVAFPY